MSYFNLLSSFLRLDEAGEDEAHLQRGCEPGVTVLNLAPAGAKRMSQLPLGSHCCTKYHLLTQDSNWKKTGVRQSWKWTYQELCLQDTSRYFKTSWTWQVIWNIKRPWRIHSPCKLNRFFKEARQSDNQMHLQAEWPSWNDAWNDATWLNETDLVLLWWDSTWSPVPCMSSLTMVRFLFWVPKTFEGCKSVVRVGLLSFRMLHGVVPWHSCLKVLEQVHLEPWMLKMHPEKPETHLLKAMNSFSKQF